jgi:AcrR family transcriptional regulator
MRSPVLREARDSPGSLSGLLERERLFAAILAEARTHGYLEIGVEAVAARAGLSEACFHEHFSGTEECLLAALHSLAIRAHAQVFSFAAGPIRPDPLGERRAWHEPYAEAHGAGRAVAGRVGREHDPEDERLDCALACLAPILAATLAVSVE